MASQRSALLSSCSLRWKRRPHAELGGYPYYSKYLPAPPTNLPTEPNDSEVVTSRGQ